MKNLIIVFLLTVFFAISSCKKDDINSDIGGNQSTIGEVGNTVSLRAGQFGIEETNIYASKLENGVSTFVCSGIATDSYYIDLLKMVPSHHIPGTVNIDGNNVEITINAKVTDEGGQVVFNDGSKFTLVKYDAKVGDKYTVEVNGNTLVNEVVNVSTDDDFFWGGMYIKVITVKSSSSLPGVSYVEHYYNHKFGLVGLAIYFEDGSVKYAGIDCGVKK
jgi:uncharacterized protein (UPF0333 family)